MALTPFTGTVSAATFNANFSDANAAMTSQAVAGQVDMAVHHKAINVAAAASPAVASYVDFTPNDDLELRVLRVYGLDAAGGMTATATLTVANGDTTFLLDQTISATTASLGAAVAAQATTDYRTVTGTRLRLLQGVPYRLALSCSSGTCDEIRGSVLLRTIRRQG